MHLCNEGGCRSQYLKKYFRVLYPDAMVHFHNPRCLAQGNDTDRKLFTCGCNIVS